MDSVKLLAYIMAGGRLFCDVMGSRKRDLCNWLYGGCWRKAVMIHNLHDPCVLWYFLELQSLLPKLPYPAAVKLALTFQLPDLMCFSGFMALTM